MIRHLGSLLGSFREGTADDVVAKPISDASNISFMV